MCMYQLYFFFLPEINVFIFVFMYQVTCQHIGSLILQCRKSDIFCHFVWVLMNIMFYFIG